MSRYLFLFSLTVLHRFFDKEACKRLEFVATKDSAKFIDKIGLVVKYLENSIQVFYDEDRKEAMRLFGAEEDKLLSLEFKVFSKDPFFSNYTEPEPYKEDSLLYFRTSDATVTDSEKFRLHKEEYVTEDSFTKLGAPELRGVLDNEDIFKRPAFVVKVDLLGSDSSVYDENLNLRNRNYYLKFDSTKTYWKYYLFGGGDETRLSVSEATGEVEFDLGGRESLPGDRVALTYISRSGIPLSEKSPYKLQLREKSLVGEKIVVKWLPVPSPEQIARKNIDGKDAAVSEMYVYI